MIPPSLQGSPRKPSAVGLRWIVLLPLLLGLTSCLQTPGNGSSRPGPSISGDWRSSGEWELVREQPETYFPTGTPHDQPTDHRAGEWVMGGINDPIFFVPRKGANGKSQLELVQQAQTFVGVYEPPQIASADTGGGPLAFLGDRDKPEPATDGPKTGFDVSLTPGMEASGPSVDTMGPPAPPAGSDADSVPLSNKKLSTDDFWQPGVF